jgi:hypothetical protein
MEEPCDEILHWLRHPSAIRSRPARQQAALGQPTSAGELPSRGHGLGFESCREAQASGQCVTGLAIDWCFGMQSFRLLVSVARPSD